LEAAYVLYTAMIWLKPAQAVVMKVPSPTRGSDGNIVAPMINEKIPVPNAKEVNRSIIRRIFETRAANIQDGIVNGDNSRRKCHGK
jgi:hypothetical protein